LGAFLLDDHEVVRTGLRALLEAGDDQAATFAARLNERSAQEARADTTGT
jgi:DNA-binding NarL/FixJ family response regulator